MPFKSEKQRRYLWANEPEIARDWSEKYGSKIQKARGGRIPFANGSFFNPYKKESGQTGFFPDVNAMFRNPLKEQFSNIMTQFPSKGGISPLYESAV